MARERDYAAEARRRWQLELERAEREGRAPDKAKSRGHGSHERENERRRNPNYREQRRLNYWTKRSAYGVPLPRYREVVRDAVKQSSRQEVIDIMRRKVQNNEQFLARLANGIPYERAAAGSQGHADYEAFQAREVELPPELFWYRATI